MRLSRSAGCMLVGGVYVILRVTIPMLGHQHVSALLLIVTSVALMMLVQLALAVCIAGLGWKPGRSALWALGSGLVFAGLLILMNHPRLSAPAPILRALDGTQQLSLMLLASFLGCTISHIVREANMLLPVAMVAAIVDYWNVSQGPLGHFIATKPAVVSAVAVQMPSPVKGIPGAMIGMGDFVFLALYFSVLFRFSMNAAGTFWLGYAVLTASMLAVTKVPALPALVPMGLAVVIANRRHFKLSREEKKAVLVVGLVLLALVIAAGFITLRE